VPTRDTRGAFRSHSARTRRFDISRESVLADAVRFGFGSQQKAEHHLKEALTRIEVAFGTEEAVLDYDWKRELRARAVTVLRAPSIRPA